MHRLFVAIRPPGPVRARLLAVMGGVAGARWQTEDQLHLTLRFIGDVDRHLARDVDAALSGVHHPRFSIALNGLGGFERRGEPVTLWAGIAPHEPLHALHKKVDQAVGSLIEQSGGISGPAFDVGEFCLYESRLTPEGPVYTIVERYPLD
jgi:2'-5' RNA ligase